MWFESGNNVAAVLADLMLSLDLNWLGSLFSWVLLVDLLLLVSFVFDDVILSFVLEVLLYTLLNVLDRLFAVTFDFKLVGDNYLSFLGLGVVDE